MEDSTVVRDELPRMTGVLIRLDANGSIGLGHLGRCLALAGALRELETSVAFALSRASSEEAFQRLSAAGETVIEVPNEAMGSVADAEATRDIAEEMGVDAIVLDGYQFRHGMLPGLRSSAFRLAYIDDLLAGAFDVDLFVNPSLHGDRCQVMVPDGAVILLGAAYSLIRAPFVRARKQAAEKRKQARDGERLRVLVSMGGTDPGGISLAVLAALAALPVEACSNLEVAVLLSPAFHGWDEARRLAATCASRVTLQTTVPELAILLPGFDFAVASASTTLAELATVGVPTIAMATVDNQELVAEAAARLGVARVVGVNAVQIGTAIVDMVGDPEGRSAMANRQREVVDGLGPTRIARAIVGLGGK